MTSWKNDEELYAVVRAELGTCVVSDVMEQLGFHHPMLPHEIQPLRRGHVMLGRALPVQDDPPLPRGAPELAHAKPFGLMFESIEDLQPGEVYVATGCPTYAARLGDMLTLRIQKRGAAGIVLDANARDVKGIRELDLPFFARGSYAYGLQGRHNVVDFRCPIQIGKVPVRPGDLVFGDDDGVCIVPRDAEEEIVRRALDKARREEKVRKVIEEGGSVVDAFKEHEVM